MVKKVRWVYGEVLRKRWDVSIDILYRFIEDGLPVYNTQGRRIKADDIEESVDYAKFRHDDVLKFEDHNQHLFENVAGPLRLRMDDEPAKNDGIDKRLTAEEVAALMKVNVKKVRSMYKELGGMRLGRNYLFFERRVKDAIQKRTEVDSPSAEGREATGEGVSEKEAGIRLGGQDAAKARKRMEREDRHGLFK